MSSAIVERHRFRGDLHVLAAKIIDEDVDGAVPLQGRWPRLLAGAGWPDSRRDGPRLAGRGPNVAGGPPRAGPIAADEDHVGPRVRDRDRHFPPQPATAAGDEESLPR